MIDRYIVLRMFDPWIIAADRSNAPRARKRQSTQLAMLSLSVLCHRSFATFHFVTKSDHFVYTFLNKPISKIIVLSQFFLSLIN